jgi:hypothetical protein
MPDETRIAVISAGRQRNQFCNGSRPEVELNDRGADIPIVKANAGNHMVVRQLDQLRPANFHAGILPSPIRVRRFRMANNSVSIRARAITAEQANGSVIRKEDQSTFIGRPFAEESRNQHFEFPGIFELIARGWKPRSGFL